MVQRMIAEYLRKENQGSKSLKTVGGKLHESLTVGCKSVITCLHFEPARVGDMSTNTSSVRSSCQ